MGRVSGKVAIVTGAARGMGAVHAKRLIEEGANVMLTDVLDASGEATAKSLGAHARYLHHDVTREVEWQNIVAQTEATFGPISVLVNNAGIFAAAGPTDTVSEAAFRHVMDVNALSVFLGMKTVLASMKRAGGGSIVNISSGAGIVGTNGGLAYGASKFAVRGMTKCAAIEFAPFNIRVNSIHPGLIATEMLADTPEDARNAAAAATPANRLGDPLEVANVVLMLASDESRFSTGAEFVVDGGMSSQ